MPYAGRMSAAQTPVSVMLMNASCALRERKTGDRVAYAKRCRSHHRGRPVTTQAQFIVMSASQTLTDERVLAAGVGLTLADAGAGNNATFAADDSAVAMISGSTFNLASGPIQIDAGGASALRISGTMMFMNRPSSVVTPVTSGTVLYISGGVNRVTLYIKRETGAEYQFEPSYPGVRGSMYPDPTQASSFVVDGYMPTVKTVHDSATLTDPTNKGIQFSQETGTSGSAYWIMSASSAGGNIHLGQRPSFIASSRIAVVDRVHRFFMGFVSSTGSFLETNPIDNDTPTAPCVGIQFVRSRDTNFQFITTDGTSFDRVDTGIAVVNSFFNFEVKGNGIPEVGGPSQSVWLKLLNTNHVIRASHLFTGNMPNADFEHPVLPLHAVSASGTGVPIVTSVAHLLLDS